MALGVYIGLIALLPMLPNVAKAHEIDPGLILATTEKVQVVETVITDKGPGALHLSSGKFAVVSLPAGAKSFKLGSKESLSQSFSLETTQTVQVLGDLPGVAVKEEESQFLLKNEAKTSVIVLVQDSELKDIKKASILKPNEELRIDRKPKTALYIVDAESYSMVKLVVPAIVLPLKPSASGSQSPPQRAATSEGLVFNESGLSWEGLRLAVSGTISSRLRMDVPRFRARVDNNGDLQNIELRYRHKKFQAASVGLVADLGIIELSFHYFSGQWTGKGQIKSSFVTGGGGGDPPIPETTTEINQRVDLKGKLQGYRVRLFWPAFVYRSGSFKLGVGPLVGFLYIEEELEEIRDFRLAEDLDDRVRERAGEGGLQVTISSQAKRVGFGASVSSYYVYGDLNGFVVDGSVSLIVPF